MLKQDFFDYILRENKNPTFIMDFSGILLSFNQESTKIIPELKKDLKLSAFFIEDDAVFFDDILEAVKKYDSIIFKKSSFIFSEGTPIEVLATKFTFELQTYLLCTFNPANSAKNRVIPSDCDIEKLPLKSDLCVLIKRMVDEYPFSLISKAKFSNELENYSYKIWIKDKDNKIVVVNSAYATKIGYSKVEIEGLTENDISKITGSEFNRKIDSFLLNSFSNTKIVMEMTILDKKPFRTIKIPIYVNNSVIGVISIAEDIIINKATTITEEKRFEYKNLLNIDENNRITACKDEIFDVLTINKNENLYYKNIDILFDEDFVSEIERYRNNFRERKSHQFIYLLRQNSRVISEFDISLQKVFSGNIVTGISINFNLSKNNSNNKEQGIMYDSILQLIPQPMFVYEIDNLKFLNVNEAALALYGYSRDEFLQMDLTDLYAPEDIQTLIESANKKSKDNEFTGPWRQKRRDGRSIIVELSKSVVDFNGKRAHINFIRDITNNIETEKQVVYYKAVFENTSDMVIIVDQDGFIVFTNTSVSNNIGYSKDELDKRPVISLVADDFRARFNSMVLNSATGSNQRLDLELKTNSNDRIPVKLVATPIKNHNGDNEAFILVISVIVEQTVQVKEVERIIESNNNSALDPSFLSHLFHEILTPINVIVGFAQELSESITNPSEEQQEASDIISENQKLLMKIMDNASEYVALESKKIELNPEKVVFVELIDDLQNNLKELTESKNKSFTYGKISSSLFLQTDKHKLLTLLNLFFTFAINTTKEEKIYLSAYSFNSDDGIISIKDNSSGITSILLKKMKEILVADEEVVRRNYGISRFTLRLLRKLMFLLSAKVEEITKAGKVIELGIRFPLKFTEVFINNQRFEKSEEPAAEKEEIVKEKEIPAVKPTEYKSFEQEKPVLQPEPNQQNNLVSFFGSPAQSFETKTKETIETASSQKSPIPTPQAVELSKYSCLYVEDQSDSQVLFKSQMRGLKSVQFATSFEDAIPLLEANKFDFIVMDMNLQGEYNGLDALRIIQRMPSNKSVPVIAVTAYVLPGDREKFIAAGFSDFISKPVMRDKLVDVLKKIFT
ncbi:MAG: PAS domain S-box protein [bacterium]